MILVTGASGLLGSFVCKSLVNKGENVRALVRKNSNLELLTGFEKRLDIKKGDILDLEDLNEAFEGVKTIIHCAAIISFDPHDRDMMNQINVEGTGNLVNLALEHNIDYFMHISSVAALGRQEKNGNVDENCKWQESKYNTAYGESKYISELEVWRGIQENLPAVILNPSVILGAGEEDRSSTRLFKYVWDENKYCAKGNLNYVDIRDVDRIIGQLLTLKPTGQRFIINGGSETYKNVFDLIGKCFNKKPPTKFLAESLVFPAIWFEKIKSFFTGKEPLLSAESARLSSSRINFDNSKIKKELNFKFADLSDTVEWVCKEMIKKYKPQN